MNDLSIDEKLYMLEEYTKKHHDNVPPEMRLSDVHEVIIPPEVQKRIDDQTAQARLHPFRV